MNELTQNIRTHIVLLNDWREIQITQKQYATLKLMLEDNKFSDPLVITDPDNWNILFDWKCWAIKEFKHKQWDNSEWDLYWICTYWLRHRIIDWECISCTCREKIWITDLEFLNILRDMWYKINYPKDVTDEMIRAYKIKNVK